MSFSTIWLSWKQEYSKLLQISLLKTWAKRQLSVMERLKILHEEEYSEKQISEKLKFIQDVWWFSELAQGW